MKIAILGSSGFLGQKIYSELKNEYSIIHNGIRKRKFDLNNLNNLKKFLKKKIDVLINAAAETNINLCEVNNNTKKINENLLKNIFFLKRKLKKNFFLIHFSTDQLYNNINQKYNNENAKTFALNKYSKQKINSEKICKKMKALILRTNFIGKSKSGNKTLTDFIFNSFSKKKNIHLLDDIFFNPLSITSLVKIIKKIIQKKLFYKGTFNLGSRGCISKYELAKLFAKEVKIYSKNYTITQNKNFFKVHRPNYMCMNINKFENRFKIILPSTYSEIKVAAKDYEKKN